MPSPFALPAKVTPLPGRALPGEVTPSRDSQAVAVLPAASRRALR